MKVDGRWSIVNGLWTMTVDYGLIQHWQISHQRMQIRIIDTFLLIGQDQKIFINRIEIADINTITQQIKSVP